MKKSVKKLICLGMAAVILFTTFIPDVAFGKPGIVENGTVSLDAEMTKDLEHDKKAIEEQGFFDEDEWLDMHVSKGFTTKILNPKIYYLRCPITWSTGDSGIATLDENGYCTGVSYGKTELYATLIDGTKYFCCNIIVGKNVYSYEKYAVKEATKGTVTKNVYKAGYDSKGNLVIKVQLINRWKYTYLTFKNVKIVICGADKTYTFNIKDRSYDIKPGKTKCITITIKKSKLPNNKIDLYNSDDILMNSRNLAVG